jgi:protein-disulfide isomerase
VLESYQNERPGAIRLVFKDYPLDPKCNVRIKTSHHAAACEAAAAVRMARDRGKEDEMIQWILPRQKMLTPADMRVGAAEILGPIDFDREYAAKLADIKKDIDEADALGLQSTPSVYVNGKHLDDSAPIPELGPAVAHELQKARGR